MKNEIKRKIKVIFSNEIIVDGKYFEVHQDWEFPIQGFFILTSKRKIRSIADFSEEESKEFINILRKVRKAMKIVLKIKEVFIYQNEDTQHNFHVWIFPKHAWMKNFRFHGTPAVSYLKQSLKQCSKKDIEKVKFSARKMRDYLLK